MWLLNRPRAAFFIFDASDHVGAGVPTRPVERNSARTGQLALARADDGAPAYANRCHSFFELDTVGMGWHSSSVHSFAIYRLQVSGANTEVRFSPQ